MENNKQIDVKETKKLNKILLKRFLKREEKNRCNRHNKLDYITVLNHSFLFEYSKEQYSASSNGRFL